MVSGGIVDARRASIVAYYDGLPGALAELVGHLQRTATERLGLAFEPRPAEQVHATLIGLENPPPEFADDDRSRFDARPLAGYLVRTVRSRALELQFGGAAAGDPRWPSRGGTRYERSFLVGPVDVVLIGWPVQVLDGDPVPLPALAEIRHGCERFGVRHRYHVGPGAHDPDAYLVIGRLVGPADAPAGRLAAAIRHELAAAPVRVRLGPEQLSLVEYDDTSLPLASTRRRALAGF